MKAAYEIVRAEELRAGDAYAFGSFDELYQFVASRVERVSEGVRVVVDETEDRIELNHAFLYGEGVARQLPPERNPEVLMRALEIACTEKDDDGFPEYCIELAIRELESEAGNVHG